MTIIKSKHSKKQQGWLHQTRGKPEKQMKQWQQSQKDSTVSTVLEVEENNLHGQAYFKLCKMASMVLQALANEHLDCGIFVQCKLEMRMWRFELSRHILRWLVKGVNNNIKQVDWRARLPASAQAALAKHENFSALMTDKDWVDIIHWVLPEAKMEGRLTDLKKKAVIMEKLATLDCDWRTYIPPITAI